MKFSVFIFSLFSCWVFSQQLSIQYLVEKQNINQVFTLDINGENSFFYSDEYCDSNREEIFNTAFYIKKGNESIYIIYDKLEDLDISVESKINQKWELLNETKVENNIKLYKAKTKYKGKEWFAWYDADSPINSSPFIFNKLPGTIYEIYTDNLKISLVSIENKLKKCVSISPKTKLIKRGVYDKYNKDLLENISKGFNKHLDVFGAMGLQDVLQEAVKKDLFREYL